MSLTTIAEHLSSLEREAGTLSPHDVVESARHEDSPLHSYFTWDDTEAAKRYRLYQASALIRKVRIEVGESAQAVSCPIYVRNPEAAPNTREYQNVFVVRNDADKAREVMLDEMKRIISAIERAKRVAAVLGDDKEIDRIKKRVDLILARHVDDHPTTM